MDGFQGTAVIDTEAQIKHILSNMALTDIWGIGNRLGKRLSFMGL